MPNERGALQPAAQGLLSLLQLKQRGSNPDTLADTVVPTIDLTHWYGQESLQAVGDQFVLTTAVVYANLLLVGAFGNLVVPSGEIWWVQDYRVVIEGTVGTTTAINVNALHAAVLSARESGVGRASLIGEPSRPFTTVGAAGMVFAAPSLRDFWATAGSGFGAYLNGSVTDAVNPLRIFGIANVVRLKV